MEPVTHFLTGAVLARTGFNRKTALATVTMALAAEAADLDVVAYVRGSAEGFIQHRGITHTFLAVPVVAAVTMAAVWAADKLWQRLRGGAKRKPAVPLRWGWLYLGAVVAALSHLLLDFTNNYGVRPFYPFRREWFAWDIVFIVEPLLLLALIAALTLPWLFGLIGAEIGARRKGPAGRRAAIAALVFMVLLWGVRDFEHRRALAVMDTRLYNGESAERLAAFPEMVNPFRWQGVAETSTAYVSLPVDSLHSEIDAQGQAVTCYKPEPTAASTAARASKLGRAYMEWARFPIVEDEHISEPAPHDVVQFQDVRFLDPVGKRKVLEAYVLLDANRRVLEQGFRPPQR
ncbi:MAG: metal-dependent hydrolase [Acidobacteriota bacterium]|nr:metal-dependent hydrolase [Acidobacteriota bacterium]